MRNIKVLFLFLAATLGMSTVAVNNDRLYEISKNIEVFVNTYKELNSQYVDDVDPTELMKVGIDAMMNSLDPYTRFISESQIESYRILTDKKYDGIGASSVNIDGKIVIKEPFEDSPADKAGLKAGDVIIAVDGKTTIGKSSEDMNAVVRGLPGTNLELTIERPGVGQLDKTISRGSIVIKNVPYYGMVSDEIGYISLTTFTADAGKNIAKGLEELKKNEGLKGVIIDLRYNGGGLLREAIAICNLFVPQNEEVVSTRCKVRERDQHFKTMRSPMDIDIPLAVMINKRSASASEIVSGVLQDLDRAVIIGQRSFGKGLVQNTMDLGYNNRLKVTTSKYYIPSGRCIQGKEYKDGEPVEISDDKRSTFYTKNKRPVLDGGGVTPDIKLEAKKQSAFVTGLIEEHAIFNYVTQWVAKHDSIDEIGKFKFMDYADFESYLKQSQFSYKSGSQKLLDQLEEESKNEEIESLIAADIKALNNKIKSAHAKSLMEEKAMIVQLIEKEIATRYYYQRGKVQQQLENDNEIEEAISVLLDTPRYKKILKQT